MIRRFLDAVFSFVSRQWPILLLVVGILFFLMRMHWSLRILAAAVVVFVILVAILGAAIAVRDLFTSSQGDPNFITRLRSRAQQARDRVKKLRGEIRDIESKMSKLQAIGEEASESNGAKQKGKSLALLRGYKDELALRNTKLEFYDRSLKSFIELERKWVQERDLNAMQKDLEKLRTPNAKDSDSMQALSAELVYERELLKTYRGLSKQIDRAETIASAKKVRTDLDRLLE